MATFSTNAPPRVAGALSTHDPEQVRFTTEARIPLVFGGYLARATPVPIESFAGLGPLGLGVSLEWLLGLSPRQAIVPTDWVGVVVAAPSAPVVWGGFPTVPGNVPAEWRMPAGLAGAAPVDWLLGIQPRRAGAPVDWAAGAAPRLGVPLTWGGSAVRAGTVPFEAGGLDPDAIAHRWDVRRLLDQEVEHDWTVVATAMPAGTTFGIEHRWGVVQNLQPFAHRWNVMSGDILAIFGISRATGGPA